MANVTRTIRKFFVSGFVVFTFVAYALHERVVHSTAPINGRVPEQTAIALVVPSPTQLVPATPVPTATEIPVPVTSVPVVPPTQTLVPTAPQAVPTTAVAVPTDAPVPTQIPAPTDTPVPTSAPKVAGAQYKDGEYTGPVTDAYYGNLQVKAVIQNGKIANVQFLDYPHDRRTSQRINSQAMPYLQEEAIQAQNANVDIISGATLTSQAFVESLQAALNSAKS